MTELGHYVQVIDCEHRTAPAADDEAFGYSIGTRAVRHGRLDLGRAKPVSRQTYDAWTRRAIPRPGDLIFSREAPMGEVAAVPVDVPVCLGQRTVLLRGTTSALDEKFLLYVLMSPQTQRWIGDNAAGSTVLHLNVADVRRIPLPWVPALQEQRHIVAILEDHLSRLDAADAYLKTVGKRLKVMVKSILTDLIPDVVDYPETWERSTVAEAGTIELGRQRHPHWHTGSNMKPYLRVANVFEDRIDTSDLMEMHWPAETFERFRLRAGDVLLNEGQTPELLGRPAIYRGNPTEVAFTNSLLRFKVNHNVLPEFALLVFRRHMHAGRFIRESRITTNIAHLSARRLKPIEFPIPALVEQERIVKVAAERLDSVRALETELGFQQTRSATLRRSLLAVALSGRLATGRGVEALDEAAR